MNMKIEVTESAAKQINALRTKDNNPALMLRVTVLGGGCSGFQYQLEMDGARNPGDVTFERDGAVVITDETSLPLLDNAVVDYERGMMKSAFKIRNPNAAASCGCGNSFAVKM